MAGLVSPPPGIDPADATIVADGWFPPIRLSDVRDRVRVGDGKAVTTPRLTMAIEGAMISALRELADWRFSRVQAGCVTLAAVTPITLNDRNMAVILWERLIVMLAAAELADLHRDLSATNDGLDRAEERGVTADDYRRLAYAAIADLQSIGGEAVPRNRVSLL